MHFFYQIVNYSIIEAAAALGVLDLPDDMPPAERKLKELEYQLVLKDLINSGLQEELTRIQNSLNKAAKKESANIFCPRNLVHFYKLINMIKYLVII